MRWKYFLAVIIGLTSQLCYSQLSDPHKLALLDYFEKMPSLSKFDGTIKHRVMNDPALSTELSKCLTDLKQFADFEKMINTKDPGEVYSLLGQLMPDQRDVYIPEFFKERYQSTKMALQNMKPLNAASHSTLVNLYNAARLQDRLSPQNAFGSMQVMYAEQVEGLKKAATRTQSLPISDNWLMHWLEMNYYFKVRNDGVGLMKSTQTQTLSRLAAGCLGILENKLKAEAEAETNNPQNWVGEFYNFNFLIKLEEKGGFTFASYDIKIGNESESMQWNLTIEGGAGKGDWVMVAENKDYTAIHKGPITVKLKGDVMTYEMIHEDEPEVKWKEGVKPRERGGNLKGARLFGELKRKVK